MIAQQVGGKAVRDALFLTIFGVTALPSMMAAGAVMSLVVVLSASRMMARHSPRNVIPVVFALNAILLAMIWALARGSPRAAAVGLYLDTAVLGPVLISGFWSLVNEQFAPHTARTAVARIASGGTLGGVLGGLGTWRLSSAVELPTSILFLALANAVCVAGALAVRKQGAPDVAATTPSVPRDADISPATALRTTPILRSLALLVTLGSAVSSLLDYVFSAQATLAYGRGPELLAFFSLFGLGVSVLSLALQLTLGRVAMERVGLAVNIAVLPGIVILGSAFGLAVPSLVSATALRGAEMVQRNTLFRSAYELLYTPLAETSKRATKALIDVGFDRLGTVLGSGAAMLVLALSHHAQIRLLWIVVFLALSTLPLARQLHHGYVGALEQGLREGAQKLSLQGPAPGRPSMEVEEPTRDRLIEKIESLRHPEESLGTAGETLARGSELLPTARTLFDADPERARAALSGWTDARRALTDLAIAHLAHPTLHVEARAALRAIAPRVVGHLVDALVDPHMEFSVRRRVPAVLSVCRTQRAVEGLLLGVRDDRFEVRYACARALLRITDDNPDVALRRETIIEAVQKEVARVEPQSIEPDDPGELEHPWSFSDALEADRVNRRLEHIFTILALLLDREPLRLAFRALHHEDGRHRGTALEYLQTVMPSELRDAVWPLLGESGPLPAPRAAAEVLADLAHRARLAGDFASLPASQPMPAPIRAG
jgi:hypothetical protein